MVAELERFTQMGDHAKEEDPSEEPLAEAEQAALQDMLVAVGGAVGRHAYSYSTKLYNKGFTDADAIRAGSMTLLRESDTGIPLPHLAQIMEIATAKSNNTPTLSPPTQKAQ